jgi:hypothetical protein
MPIITVDVALGSLVVARLALDPRFASLNPAADDGLLRVIEIRSTTSFGGEVKPSVHVIRFYDMLKTLRV